MVLTGVTRKSMEKEMPKVMLPIRRSASRFEGEGRKLINSIKFFTPRAVTPNVTLDDSCFFFFDDGILNLKK